ncbi:MAG: ATP-dependent helicase HrpB [Emcibacter sp.]|nr:ATP-dependent helicase HrpB [Emcibacter sp.]
MLLQTMNDLPIFQAVPEILQQLCAHNSLVLQAPPGAGKTTVVPLCLMDQPWFKGDSRIIMLAPRRLAARAAARRMADLLGEKVGQTVGYRVRLDHKVSAQTRIEVVTEGVLIRKLQQDPELNGISAIIFDEFHERSQEADLGLALCLDIQQGLREELKLIVMSATLDGENVARLMGGAPVVTSQGRAYPVDLRYLDRPPPAIVPIERTVADTILQAVQQESGSILVFLPGAGEIERCAALVRGFDLGQNVIIAPLYGMMPAADQDQAILNPPAGKRKIVLATAIAETSLTIDGICIVIDGGLDRSPRYDARTGMARLETRRLSRASAEQRAGRAGRTAPGICFRMWTAAAQRGLMAFSAPEITKADLGPLALELARWGIRDPEELRWLDVPDSGSMAAARDILISLGALDDEGRILAHGKKMVSLAMHPRLAHMVLKAKEVGLGRLGVEIAALLAERDILRHRSTDVRHRVEALRYFCAGDRSSAQRMGGDLIALQQVKKQVEGWCRSLKISKEEDSPLGKAGFCLALAYPDRIGMRRKGAEPRYHLSGGSGAALDAADSLGGEKYLAICHLAPNNYKGVKFKSAQEPRIYLTAPLDEADIWDIFSDQITTVEQIEWDERRQLVQARKRQMLGQLVIHEEKLTPPPPDRVVPALCDGIRKMGLVSLPWDKQSIALRARILFCARYDPAGSWPDLSDEALLAGLEDWLGPYLEGIMSREQLTSKLALAEILKNFLTWPQQEALDRLAPSHYPVPSGSKITLDYRDDPPVLAVRLQEMFGLDKTPAIMAGKVTLLVHLLSPAGRPIQVTQDLENFWGSSYEAVKKDMKGRYPKHHWPDDPLAAKPTSRSLKSRRKKK